VQVSLSRQLTASSSVLVAAVTASVTNIPLPIMKMKTFFGSRCSICRCSAPASADGTTASSRPVLPRFASCRRPCRYAVPPRRGVRAAPSRGRRSARRSGAEQAERGSFDCAHLQRPEPGEQDDPGKPQVLLSAVQRRARASTVQRVQRKGNEEIQPKTAQGNDSGECSRFIVLIRRRASL